MVNTIPVLAASVLGWLFAILMYELAKRRLAASREGRKLAPTQLQRRVAAYALFLPLAVVSVWLKVGSLADTLVLVGWLTAVVGGAYIGIKALGLVFDRLVRRVADRPPTAKNARGRVWGGALGLAVMAQLGFCGWLLMLTQDGLRARVALAGAWTAVFAGAVAALTLLLDVPAAAVDGEAGQGDAGGEPGDEVGPFKFVVRWELGLIAFAFLLAVFLVGARLSELGPVLGAAALLGGGVGMVASRRARPAAFVAVVLGFYPVIGAWTDAGLRGQGTIGAAIVRPRVEKPVVRHHAPLAAVVQETTPTTPPSPPSELDVRLAEGRQMMAQRRYDDAARIYASARGLAGVKGRLVQRYYEDARIAAGDPTWIATTVSLTLRRSTVAQLRAFIDKGHTLPTGFREHPAAQRRLARELLEPARRRMERLGGPMTGATGEAQ